MATHCPIPDDAPVINIDLNVIKSSDNELKDEPIDILILNSGISGDKNNDELSKIYRENILNTINVNCIGPLLIGQSLFENIKISKRKQIIGITSLMGSITDNLQNGGRISKNLN